MSERREYFGTGLFMLVVIAGLVWIGVASWRDDRAIDQERVRCQVLHGYYVVRDRACLAGVDSTISVTDR